MWYHDRDIYHILSKEINLLVYDDHVHVRDRDHDHVLQHVSHPFEQLLPNDHVLKQVQIFLELLLIYFLHVHLQLFIRYLLDCFITLFILEHFINLFRLNFLNFKNLLHDLARVLFMLFQNHLFLIFYVL